MAHIHPHLLLCRIFRHRLFLVGNRTVVRGCYFGRCFVDDLLWFGRCCLVAQASEVSQSCASSLDLDLGFVVVVLFVCSCSRA